MRTLFLAHNAWRTANKFGKKCTNLSFKFGVLMLVRLNCNFLCAGYFLFGKKSLVKSIPEVAKARKVNIRACSVRKTRFADNRVNKPIVCICSFLRVRSNHFFCKRTKNFKKFQKQQIKTQSKATNYNISLKKLWNVN